MPPSFVESFLFFAGKERSSKKINDASARYYYIRGGICPGGELDEIEKRTIRRKHPDWFSTIFEDDRVPVSIPLDPSSPFLFVAKFSP